ncbi:tigger transposable element-derived protein 6-like [Haliotis rubra]|uniref:tigger transposable element-derived protein 6-like n=1 Tax=Haliotis rubra TaxID=36100 RepID=UPI001EE55D29|nr:tigger transposable element-derived protein 6-like [Haliotis rubra]
MTALIFKDWLVKFDRHMRTQRRQVILLIDNAPSHASVDLTNVKLHYLPPNTTSHIQPLDAGIIKNFKLLYKKQQMKLHLDNASADTPVPLDIKQALLFIRSAWRDVKQPTIINCWRHTKILPPTDSQIEPDNEPIEDVRDLQETLDKLYPDAPAPVSEFIEFDANLPCEEAMTEDEIIETVRPTAEKEINTEEDQTTEPVIPKLPEVKTLLNTLQTFVTHNLDVFDGSDLDFIDTLKTKMQKTSEKNEQQKTLKDYFKF